MKVQFSRCTSSNLSHIPEQDGQIIFVKDTSEQYIDTNYGRNKITDIFFVYSPEDFRNIRNPQPGRLYYDVTNNSIKFYCNDRWQSINYVDMENILTKDNTTPYTPTSDYHPATKKYVDDTVESSKGLYSKTFTEDDWETVGQDNILTILQSEHKLNSPYIVSIEKNQNNEFKTVSMYGSKLLPNGSLQIISDINLKYSGRILLKGGN